MSGGGQERGIRSGTVATPLVVGLGKACEVALREMETDSEHVRRLESKLREGIQGGLAGVVLNGPDDAKHRWAGGQGAGGRVVGGG
jgi:cysteine desulfurase